MPPLDETASSITTASLGRISPMALSSAIGCTGTLDAAARALALNASRAASVAFWARSSRSLARARVPAVIRSRTAAQRSGSVALGSPMIATSAG